MVLRSKFFLACIAATAHLGALPNAPHCGRSEGSACRMALKHQITYSSHLFWHAAPLMGTIRLAPLMGTLATRQPRDCLWAFEPPGSPGTAYGHSSHQATQGLLMGI
eukprot:1157415-Pelagomonas_calceolata.AAC.4